MNGVFLEMEQAIRNRRYPRRATDPCSPAPQTTLEAEVGTQFRCSYPIHNVVYAKSIDLKWAVANVLHFFTGSDYGAVLLRYNREAARFLDDGDRWKGAYGWIAMPQIRRCAARLHEHPQSRRPVVSMGEFPEDDDINRPACWSFLQFIADSQGLHMVVHQRSLHLHRVMPYDAIVLSNILNYVAWKSRLAMASIVWTCGSVHMDSEPKQYEAAKKDVRSIIVPCELLDDPEACMSILRNPAQWRSLYGEWLSAEGQVRT